MRTPRGRTIVMSTHQLKEALVLATHVALIRRGQIAFAGERTQEMVDDTGLAVPHVYGRGRSERASLRIPHGDRGVGRKNPRLARCHAVLQARDLTIAAKDLRSRTAHQGSPERVGRVFDRDPGAVQLRLRSDLGPGARFFGRPAVAGVHFRRRAAAESQLRARNAERLPGRIAGRADPGRPRCSWAKRWPISRC